MDGIDSKLSSDDDRDGRERARVLVVEDHSDTALLLSKLLERHNFTVNVVTDSTQALEHLQAFGPDVVLLDIAMPQLDGYEIAKRIRRQLGLKELPIIAVSGYGDNKHKALCTEVGINEHLLKPVELPMLEAAISRELGEISTQS